MIYCGKGKTETIWFRSENDFEEEYCVELHKQYGESVFYVTSCYNEDWIWAFEPDTTSNYEAVKLTIINSAFKCRHISDLLDMLDNIFKEKFAGIIVKADECDGNCCENCNHRDCLN